MAQDNTFMKVHFHRHELAEMVFSFQGHQCKAWLMVHQIELDYNSQQFKVDIPALHSSYSNMVATSWEVTPLEHLV